MKFQTVSETKPYITDFQGINHQNSEKLRKKDKKSQLVKQCN